MAWTLYDGTTTYTFEIGPSGMDLAYQKTVQYGYQPTNNSNAVALLGETARGEGTITGTLLSQTQYNTLTAWYQKTQTVTLTDYLGRAFSIIITDLDMKRERSSTYPWKHTWTMKFDVFSVTEP